MSRRDATCPMVATYCWSARHYYHPGCWCEPHDRHQLCSLGLAWHFNAYPMGKSRKCHLCHLCHSSFYYSTIHKDLQKKKANSKANLVKTLLQAYNNETASSFTNTSNLISLPNPNEWVYVVITEAFLPVTHPIHLHGHGHGFFMLPSGTGTYDPTTTTLNLQNPPSRDVVLLP